MLFTSILLTVLAIPIYIFWIKKKWDEEDKRMGIFGPKTIPVLGNLLEFWKAKTQNKGIVKTLNSN